MTQEIIENNKLIAEYDGWVFVNDDKEIFPNGYYMISTEFGNSICGETDFEYHEYFDWLMPVVEKIENEYYKGFPIIVNIGKSGAYIGINPSNCSGEKYEGKLEIANTLNCNYFNDYEGAEVISKIQGVYKTVVQYLKWKNKN